MRIPSGRVAAALVVVIAFGSLGLTETEAFTDDTGKAASGLVVGSADHVAQRGVLREIA